MNLRDLIIKYKESNEPLWLNLLYYKYKDRMDNKIGKIIRLYPFIKLNKEDFIVESYRSLKISVDRWRMRMNESDFNKILFSVLFLNAKNFIRIMYTNKEKFLTSAIAEDKINYEKDFNIEYEITDMLMEKERDDQIRGIIEHMPDSIRTIVILKYQGFSNQYISDTLNVNIKDIKNKMSIFKKIVVQRKISVK